MSRKFLDPDHPMLRPLWARLIILAVCFGWAAFEFVKGNPAFGVIFGGFGVYAGYMFFFAPREPPPPS